jgi:hypothetical protein
MSLVPQGRLRSRTPSGQSARPRAAAVSCDLRRSSRPSSAIHRGIRMTVRCTDGFVKPHRPAAGATALPRERIRQPPEVDLVPLAVPLVEQLSAVVGVVEVPLRHAAARLLDRPGQPVELSLQVPKVHGPMVARPRHAGTGNQTGPLAALLDCCTRWTAWLGQARRAACTMCATGPTRSRVPGAQGAVRLARPVHSRRPAAPARSSPGSRGTGGTIRAGRPRAAPT